jgi:hypothetical protein
MKRLEKESDVVIAFDNYQTSMKRIKRVHGASFPFSEGFYLATQLSGKDSQNYALYLYKKAVLSKETFDLIFGGIHLCNNLLVISRDSEYAVYYKGYIERNDDDSIRPGEVLDANEARLLQQGPLAGFAGRITNMRRYIHSNPNDYKNIVIDRESILGGLFELMEEEIITKTLKVKFQVNGEDEPGTDGKFRSSLILFSRWFEKGAF